MKVTTMSVFSQLAKDSDVRALGLWEKLPVNANGSRWRLSQHQLETYQALTQGEADVIFNTAMTGDGKSLAGQLPVLVHGYNWKTLSMYPTNELIDDQHASFSKSRLAWQADVFFDTLNSAKLDSRMEQDDFARRGDALMSIFKNHDLILTNPDIFHYLMHQFYTLPNDAPDGYVGQLTQLASQLIFDEFHIFDAPQIISVLNALLFMREMGGGVRRHKFLFLSATPGALMSTYLRNSGLQVTEIQGRYANQGDPQHWRRILHSADIHIEPEPRAEAWVENHLEDILLPFFLHHRPKAKGAVIVNSVASAYRLYEKVRPVFEKHGLRVGINTGLTGRSARKDSYSADLLIGTSTVDVGVDFQINFLVFESQCAGTFLQRLGRLGRHSSYEKDGQTYPFEEYVAYALVPAWIEAKLFKVSEENPDPLVDGSRIDRSMFNRAIQDAYPPVADFQQYAQTWGQMQTIRILQGLGKATIREQYKEKRQSLADRYEYTYGVKLDINRYVKLKNSNSPLLREAWAFRGGNNFPCCVIDTEEALVAEQCKRVDLLQMIANYHLEALGRDEFFSEVRKRGIKPDYFEEPSPLGYFRKGSLIAERQNFKFFYNQNLIDAEESRFSVAEVLMGFELDADFVGRVAVNKKLAQTELVALLVQGYEPLYLKKRLSLPMLFPLFSFTSRDHCTGTVAFGRMALMLEARLKYLPLKPAGGIIIC